MCDTVNEWAESYTLNRAFNMVFLNHFFHITNLMVSILSNIQEQFNPINVQWHSCHPHLDLFQFYYSKQKNRYEKNAKNDEA